MRNIMCYYPNPHFMNALTANYSQYLTDHYTAVQSSLTPKQLDNFTQSLRTTFGKEGKVTLGGIAVVGQSPAVLFDTIAKQVRGAAVSDSEPIPGFFIKEPRGYYPPQIYTMSKCLRLIPHRANNPNRMRQETESCSTQLILDGETFKQLREHQTYGEDITAVNLMMSYLFEHMLRMYIVQMTNSTAQLEDRFHPNLGNVSDFSLNCDPVAADKVFLAAMENSDIYTKEAYSRCKPWDDSDTKSLIAYIAHLQFEKIVDGIPLAFALRHNDLLARRDNFDLKSNAV